MRGNLEIRLMMDHASVMTPFKIQGYRAQELKLVNTAGVVAGWGTWKLYTPSHVPRLVFTPPSGCLAVCFIILLYNKPVKHSVSLDSLL